MSYAASCSKNPDINDAIAEIGHDMATQLDGRSPDLTFLFVSHAHAEHFDQLAGSIAVALNTQVLLGCSGEMIAARDEEIEAGPAISAWCGTLPDAELEVFHLEFSQTADGILCVGFPEDLTNENRDVRAVFVLGEPFSSVPKSILGRLADELPDVPVIGGMASGASQPGGNRLFLNDQCLDHGAVGVVVRGGPNIRSVVSQGCRPIGERFIVTKAEENLVFELGGKRAMDRLHELYPSLPEREQKLVRDGLHLGIAMNEYQDSFERGDFLIANVVGADPDLGAVAIGNHVRVGQTVRFHVRDADTADEDLRTLLEGDQAGQTAPPQAALLFTCNGRGTRMFSQPSHDVNVIQSVFGPIPIAGFFAQGELGPVSNRNYIHGFTASIALFE